MKKVKCGERKIKKREVRRLSRIKQKKEVTKTVSDKKAAREKGCRL